MLYYSSYARRWSICTRADGNREGGPGREVTEESSESSSLVTIGLSSLAIIISCVSVWFSYQSLRETRQNRKINEATSRAYVRVSSALIDTRQLYKHENPKFKEAIAYLTVTNTGRTAAKNLRVEYALLASNKEEPNTRVDGAVGRAAHLQQLAPSASETIRFGIPVLIKENGLDLTERQFSLNVSLIYNDGLHSGDKLENTMVCGPKPDQQDGGLVNLYYCVNSISECDKDGSP